MYNIEGRLSRFFFDAAGNRVLLMQEGENTTLQFSVPESCSFWDSICMTKPGDKVTLEHEDWVIKDFYNETLSTEPH